MCVNFRTHSPVKKKKKKKKIEKHIFAGKNVLVFYTKKRTKYV